jgi:hypothetical protein
MGFFKAKEPKLPKVSVWPRTQAEPYAPFHPLFEGLQHAFTPYRTFHPFPFPGTGFSRLFSPFRHSHGFSSVHHGLNPSTFLQPFAPSRFRDFFAPMAALTPAQLALRSSFGHELQPFIGQVSLFHTALPSTHSITKHPTRPAIASLLPTQRDRLPGVVTTRSGLHHESAGSPPRKAESCSSSYGLHVRLRLLPTPPRGDAVTFDYRERASPEGGLSPPRSHLLTGPRTLCNFCTNVPSPRA